MATIEDLLKEVGRPYEMFDDDGYYLGCFYPVRFLYPDKPRYKLPSKDEDKNFFYGMSKLKKHCIEITPEELQAGDIIATRFKDELHVAIYWEHGKIIHVFRGHSLQVGRLKLFSSYKCFRVV